MAESGPERLPVGDLARELAAISDQIAGQPATLDIGEEASTQPSTHGGTRIIYPLSIEGDKVAKEYFRSL